MVVAALYKSSNHSLWSNHTQLILRSPSRYRYWPPVKMKFRPHFISKAEKGNIITAQCQFPASAQDKALITRMFAMLRKIIGYLAQILHFDRIFQGKKNVKWNMLAPCLRARKRRIWSSLYIIEDPPILLLCLFSVMFALSWDLEEPRRRNRQTDETQQSNSIIRAQSCARKWASAAAWMGYSRKLARLELMHIIETGVLVSSPSLRLIVLSFRN